MTERQIRLANGTRDDKEKRNMEKLIEYLIKANLLQDSRMREYVEAMSRNKALMDAFSIMQRRSFYLNVLYLVQSGRMLFANVEDKADCSRICQDGINKCDMEMNGLCNQVIGDALLSLITQPYVR